MKNDKDPRSEAASLRPDQPGRKSYKTPSVQRFGSVVGLTQGSGGFGDDNHISMTMMSDRLAKHNVTQIGVNSLGMTLNLYDYLPDVPGLPRGRQLGLMADEVATHFPDAVTMHSSGYQQVRYGELATCLSPEQKRFF